MRHADNWGRAFQAEVNSQGKDADQGTDLTHSRNRGGREQAMNWSRVMGGRTGNKVGSCRALWVRIWL